MASLTALRALTVILSSDCNLRCAYCFENAKRPGRMPWPVLRRALNLLLASSRRRVHVVFTGGEPLLEFGLVRRATRHIAARGRDGVSARLHLVTNGTLLDRPRARYLVDHDFHVQVSLDGVAPAQSLRGLETWAPLDELLTRLSCEHGWWFRNRLSVAVTAHPRTIPFLADSIDYLLEKDVREIAISPAFGPGQQWGPGRVPELEAQLGRAEHSCRRHLKRTGRVPVDIFKRRRLPRTSPPTPDCLCGVGHPHYVAVDVNGEVSGCAALARSYQRFPETALGRKVAALHRGAIGTPSLAADLARSADDIRQAGFVDNRRAKYSSHGRCATCRYATDCGVCPASIVWQAGDGNPNRIPDFQCAFNLVAARLRRRFPMAH